MTNKPNAQMIAESIDLTLASGWNLRALLLRVVNGDAWREPGHAADVTDACKQAIALCLLNEHAGLTRLGRDVCDWLTITSPKPEPWWTCDNELFDSRVTSFSDGPRAAECESAALAEAIAEALNARALSEAKQYRSAT